MDDDKKHSIFIVDDDTFLLDMYALKFSQAGFEVHTESDPNKALERITEGFKTDIVLLDIVMPELTGFELLEKIKHSQMLSGVLKVVLSNRGAQSDIEQSKKLGVADYIVKANSTPSEVVDRIKQLIKENKKVEK